MTREGTKRAGSTREAAAPDFDVLVAGYGPTGLAAASLLSRRGHRVGVFDRWPTLYGQPRVATIDGESARIIQAAADVDAALRNSIPREKYRFANERGQILVDHRWAGDHICGFPYRISLHQPDIEDAMDAAARAQGVVVHQGWEVIGVEQDADAATLLVRQRFSTRGAPIDAGPERRVRARYVIGADGARSSVRESLGITREAWPIRGAWLSYDARRKRPLHDFWGTSPDGQVAVIFCVPQGRSHSVIPLGVNHLRFNFQRSPDSDQDAELNQEAAYRHIAATYGLGPADVEVYRHAFYAFEGKLASRWRVGRAFLAGDAAHVMTPFLGQGGCAALRDAINLAWKLDLVLRGIAPDGLLDTYELERKPHVRVHVEGSDKVAAIALLDDPQAAAARDTLYLSGRAPPAPPEPTLVAGILQRTPDGGIARPVGELGPQGIVTRGERTGRFDDIAGWGFQLLGWRCDPLASLDADHRAFFARIHDIAAGLSDRADSRFLRDVNGSYAKFFAAHDIVGVLLRPDFVIFGVARDETEFRGLVDALRAQLDGAELR